MTVFRYQDNEGRGPFKPGMTERWLVDHESKPVGLIEQVGFGDLHRHAAAFLRCYPGQEFHYGFGCRSIEHLFRWFTPEERQKLTSLGYHLVAMIADRIVTSNDYEVMFARFRPLWKRAVILNIE